MKQLLVIFALVCSVKSFSQTDTAIKYSDVVSANATKEQLFQRGRQWFNETFKSSKAVLQIQDKETGELAGKGNFVTYFTYHTIGSGKINVRVNFDINIYTKDGKYKYVIQNLMPEREMVSGPNQTMPLLTSTTEYPDKWPYVSKKRADEYWNELKENAGTTVKEMVATLQAAMQKDAANF